MLSSFINRRKVKNSKISLFDAALRRAPSCTHLELQPDQENPRSKQLTKAHIPAASGLRAPALHTESSPKVHLNLDPPGSDDWFPQVILALPDEDSHLQIRPVLQSSASSAYDDVVVIGPSVVSCFVFSPHRSYPHSHIIKVFPGAKSQPGLTSITSPRLSFSDRARTRGMFSSFVLHHITVKMTPVTIQGYYSTPVAETRPGAN